MPGTSQNRGSDGPQTRLRQLSSDLLDIVDGVSKGMSEKDAHHLRTTIRRMEVAIEGAGKFHGNKKLQRQLATMRRMAGHVRDVDVHLELLKGLHAEDYGKDCENLRTILVQRRGKQEKKAIAAIEHQAGKGLKARLQTAAEALADAVPQKTPVHERLETVRQQFLDFTREVPLDGDPLHDLRKACKRLRYRLEAYPGRESRAFEKDLKTVQDAIGTWHDWATLTDQAEAKLAPRSIAFVAYLRSLTLSRRHEARRAVFALRDRLLHPHPLRKPPASAKLGAQARRGSHAVR